MPAAQPTGVAPSAREASGTSALSEAAVRGLLDDWLAAQNRGDFAAYEKLYADRFTGIKRSGERTRNFGRRDWMRDRASMFQRPMRVTTSQVNLSVSPHLARVRFEQSWSSAKYRDTGPKELLVVGGPGAALIAREEMLSSSIDGERPTAPESRLRVIDGGVVILSNEVKPDWSRGALRSATRPQADVAAVLRDADESRLPPALARWKVAPLRVLDAQGRACDARIASLAVRGAVVPHFSMNEGASDGSEPSPAQRNEAVWAMSEQGGRELVGVLEPGCDGLFALDASDVTPELYPGVTLDGPLKQAAIAAFRALPEYVAIQRRYVEETQATTPWHEDPTRHTLGVWSFTPRSGQPLLVVAADAGEYCGGFGGSANAVFALDASGKLATLGVFEDEPFAPAIAFDLDGDGRLEVLSGPEGSRRERALLRRKGSKLVRDVLFAVPFLDCPC